MTPLAHWPGLAQYVLWNWELRGEGVKPAKVPCNVSGERIDPLNPANWTDYHTAVARGQANGLGVGFVLTGSDPYCVIDLDGCYHPATGVWSSAALDAMQRFPGAFLELSVSGTGLHIWGRFTGDPATLRNRWPGGEFYFADRFIALGQALGGSVDTDNTGHVLAYVPARPDPVPVTITTAPATVAIDDMTLIGRMLDSRGSFGAMTGAKVPVRALWNGDALALASHFPTKTAGQHFDRSAADMALCSHLAFWTGKNPDQMERLWRASPLAQSRPDQAKMSRSVYVRDTIQRACETTTRVYDRSGAVAGTGGAVDPAAGHPGVTTHHAYAVAFREHGMADRFIRNSDTGQWHGWIGKRWQRMPDESILDPIRKFCAAIGGPLEKKTQSVEFWRGVLAAVKSDPAFNRPSSAFDSENYLLNTPDGTIDLRSGTIRAHSPDDYITRMTVAAPSGVASPVWESFIRDVTCGDTGLARDLQIMLGAALSGAVEDHWLAYWQGPGGNGKSVLIQALADAMGDYAGPVPYEPFITHRDDKHPSSIMTLEGRRLAYVGEIPDGRSLNASAIKSLTGDEYISAAEKHRAWQSLRRTFKIFLLGNDDPTIRSGDQAIRRRLHIVPFKADFSSNPDPTLSKRLKAEAGAILQWLVNGHKLWMAGGQRFTPGATIAGESVNFFADQGTMESWLAECAHVATFRPQQGWATGDNAYLSYRAWKINRGEEPVTRTRFGRWLQKQKGIKKVKSNVMVYEGLVLGPRGLEVVSRAG